MKRVTPERLSLIVAARFTDAEDFLGWLADQEAECEREIRSDRSGRRAVRKAARRGGPRR